MRLNFAGVDVIVMPCNTAHFFIEELREHSKAPIISIVDATAATVKEKGLKNVGLLSSAKTIQSGMYQKKLLKENVSLLVPHSQYQSHVSRFILSILAGKMNNDEKKCTCTLMKEMKAKGADAVIFACTDLRLGLRKPDICLPVVDSYEALLISAIRAMEKKHF
jgi:aspartate racemase